MTSDKKPLTLEEYGLCLDDLVRTKVLIYKRVSTDEQEDNTSLETQDEQCRDAAAFIGLPVHNVYQDVHTGMIYRRRPGLDLLRDEYKRLHAEGYKAIVIVYRFDRLSRSQLHMGVLIDEMQDISVKLVSVKDKNTDDTAIGRVTRSMQAFASEIEHEKIAARTQDGKLARVERDGQLLPGRKPSYGYEWDNPKPKAKGKLIAYEPEVRVVRTIFTMYAEGHSISAILRWLEENEIAPPLTKWGRASIHWILNNRQYTGVATAYKSNRTLKDKVAHKGKRAISLDKQIALPAGTIPALISEELFNLAHTRLATNKQDSARRGGHEALFRAGFVVCGYCNRSLVAVKHVRPYAPAGGNGERESYLVYKCSNPECTKVTIMVDKLDTEGWERIEKLASNSKPITEALRMQLDVDLLSREIKALERSIERQDELIASYMEDMQSPALKGGARALVLGMLSQAQEDKEGLEKELAECNKGRFDNERLRRNYEAIIEWCEQVDKAKAALTMLQKRDFMRVLGVIASVYRESDKEHEDRWVIEMKLPGIASSSCRRSNTGIYQ